jgi:hypothetical protein
MVSIAAFQAVDPGSIPGHRMFFKLFLANWIFKKLIRKITLFTLTEKNMKYFLLHY